MGLSRGLRSSLMNTGPGSGPAGAAGTGGPARVTALRILPASDAYPFSTGTATLGNLLITAKSSLAADVLRPLLERLGEAAGGS